MPGVPELTPTEFCARWSAAERGKSVVLLDVREHDELEAAAVADALHIPMREIPGRIEELDRTLPLVVMCHSGGRSRRVTEFLLSNGFLNVFNLRGGIDAWSTEIDPQVPRY
jgi:rhodanese-related sulfurtransferase